MNKALLVLALVSLIAAFAGAQAISAPDSIEVSQESKEFGISVSNGFDSEQSINIKLISALGYNVEPLPTKMPAYSSKEYKIKLLPTKDQGSQTVNASLVVTVGEQVERQDIEIKLADFSKKSAEGPGTGFAILPSLEGIGFGTVLDILLVIIIVILIIALFARMANRNRGQ